MLEFSTVLASLAVLTGKVTLLLVMGDLASLCLRRSSASCRHMVWAGVFGGMLVILLSATMLPSWSLLIRIPRPISELAEPFLAPGASLSIPHQEIVAHGGESSAVPHGERPDVFGATPATLVLLWLAGVGFFALRLVAGQIAVHRIAAGAREIAEESVRSFRSRAAGAGPLPRRARLVETDEISMPATWGVLRPVIALPTGAVEWPGPRLLAAVHHELAHVRRHDALTRLCADLCCGVFWFHPLVWLAARRMRLECERACDDAVLAAGMAELGYAELLLDLASAASRRIDLPQAASSMADTRGLEVRLQAILDTSTPRQDRLLWRSCILGTALAASIVLGGLRAQAAPALAVIAEVQLGELIPLTAAEEEWALSRRFEPRDEREAEAIRRFREAALHEKQHAMDFVRERAIWALLTARPDRVISPVIAQLSNEDWRARAYAAWALRLAHAPEAKDALELLLQDPVWRVRSAAAHAMVELADPQSTEDMLPLLLDPAWQVRLPAVEFLGRIRTPRALAVLREHASDPHVAVRAAVGDALQEALIQ